MYCSLSQNYQQAKFNHKTHSVRNKSTKNVATTKQKQRVGLITAQFPQKKVNQFTSKKTSTAWKSISQRTMIDYIHFNNGDVAK